MNGDRWHVDESTGCWNWAGRMNARHGYGQVRDMNAHRAIWIELRGPLPSGREWHLAHLCRNRRCVNPDHMELVTRRENILRGVGPTAMKARQTHCIHGHEFTPENTLPNGTGRKCRSCHRSILRASRIAKAQVAS